MKFAELYKDNLAAAKKALKSLWCQGATKESQKAYLAQIEKLIDEELFASENYIPLVQCMERYPNVSMDEYNNLTPKMRHLWEKTIGKTPDNEKFFTPYIHQTQAWDALVTGTADAKQSMVVTTGTGSGKTECFMLPLVNDLTNENNQAKNKGKVEAIFLYPLNALMEDQKERLHKLMTGTGLTFASYNGNLPEKYIVSDRTTKYEDRINATIEAEKKMYEGTIRATREELHQSPPNVLLTNPSMLEYMLMRRKDQHLFEDGELKWIVIDEAHTYSGAAAIELAMLIRRVLNAFGVKNPNTVRFALSSATIGNEDDEEKKTAQLLDFISGITGVLREHITPISAERVAPKTKNANAKIEACREKLIADDYVSLDKLITDGNSVYEKLQILDNMCEGESPLRAKMHFFYRVPNNGLSVMLNELNEDGTAFKVYCNNIVDAKAPMLELVQCDHCGDFFAIGEDAPGVNPSNTSGEYKFQSVVGNEGDMFDFVDDADTTNKKLLLFSLASSTTLLQKNNNSCRIDDNHYDVFVEDDKGNLVYNSKAECPHCGKKLFKKKSKDEEQQEDVEDRSINRFRISSEYMARTLAPSILPHLHEYKSKKPDDNCHPHNGQQYISFVDSRQAAARSTLNQNVEQERMWVYSRVMKLLEENANVDVDKLQKSINECNFLLNAGINNEELKQSIIKQKQEFETQLSNPYLTWEAIADKLKEEKLPDSNEKELDILCRQFVDPNNDAEIDDIKLSKEKYLHLIMKEQLGRRKKSGASPESLGLFVSYYKNLEQITERPSAVIEFNNAFSANIEIEDWKNLLKIYVDYVVRGNESFYLKLSPQNYNTNRIDIFNIERYATSKTPRRQVVKPQVNKGGTQSNIVCLLAKLINPYAEDLYIVAKENEEKINKVLDALWTDLTRIGLISSSEFLKDNVWKREENKTNKDEPLYRLNLADVAFKLYDKEMHMCRIDENSTRPVDVLFMGYSPYVIEKKVLSPKETIKRKDFQSVEEWDKRKKQLLDENGVWGESGCFASMLDKVYSAPNIFIQAEHTAQIESRNARENQSDFKNRKINILACSTTMEMGVDLGNMELVMMQSVPPHPTNYKQRAGRSGRNDDNCSVALTLCDSSAIGMRTLTNPSATLIKRRMSVPTVDVKNEKVVRRHINAFLMRKFMNENADAALDKDKVVDFFSNFIIEDCPKDNNGRSTGKRIVYNNSRKSPSDKLGESNNTLYSKFLKWLDIVELNTGNQYDGLKEELARLVKGTCCENDLEYFVKCKNSIISCYKHALLEKVQYYSDVYDELKNRLSARVIDGIIEDNYAWSIYRKYTELLGETLTKFFATNRFTPNATMPINVISFSKSPKEAWKSKYKIIENPTYSLREAISQYAPGNTVVIQNRSLVVAGVEYTGIDLRQDTTRSFDKLYSNGNMTVLEHKKSLLGNNLKHWSVNEDTALTLVKPVMYMPDINETANRTIEKNPYTQVSAQLIDVENWDGDINSNRMIDARCNMEAGNGRILYYNEGLGKGYAYCRRCGKAVAEVSATAKSLPGDFVMPHNNIRWLNKQCNDFRMISRHVVFGDYITTDFCEIRIKEEPGNKWINDRTNKKLLTTIGLLIVTSFCDYTGKDRNDIDFVLMPNGHLCVFDTNQGGAGYSNKLANSVEIYTILEMCKQRLDSIKSKEELLDKYSNRYIHDIDINCAKIWIENALDSFEKVPSGVAQKYPTSKVAYRNELEAELRNSSDAIIFVDSEFEKWNWDEWRKNLELMGANKQQVVVNCFKTKYAPIPIKQVADNIKGYTGKEVKRLNRNICGAEFSPLAKVGCKLYFTDEKTSALPNRSWAKDGAIYCVDDSSNYDVENLQFNEDECLKFILENSRDVTSKNLIEKVLSCNNKTQALIEKFKEDIRNCNTLKIKYSDEYIRTPLAMVVLMQFIDGVVSVLGFQGKVDIKILGEKYSVNRFDNDPENHLLKCYLNDIARDKNFKALAKKWNKITVEILSKWYKTLPHWRELKIVGVDKQLTIYPNGGVMNGWELANDKDDKDFDKINPNSDEYSLTQKDPKIMYDIELSDING